MANDPTTMTTKQIYSELGKLKCWPARADGLVELFAKGGFVLVNNIETKGWKSFRSNYMREHAGCAFGAVFTNSISPYINELVFRKYPQLQKYKNGNDLFDAS